MAISDITKPMALDETLQATNGKMDSVITKLQGIIDALGLDTSVYKPKGNITCAALVPALLIDDNLGNVYNVTDNGTTTSDFAEGAGKPIHVGDNVAIVDVGTGGQSEYKFDLLAGMVDLTNYIQKSNTSGLVKNDGTIDTKDYAEKVAGATNGNLAGLNSSGNLTDSGWNGAKDTTSISGNPISISGLKANQLAVNPIITLEPIQAGSGTPSPSNIRAISGYDKIEVSSCGKNLFDGTYSETGKYLNSSGGTTDSGMWNISQYIPVKASTDYYFSNINTGASSACICWYNIAKEFISATSIGGTGFTDTSPVNACYVRASIIYSATNVCINEGNTAVAYEPSNKTTDLSESLGQTVYGGSLDVRTGKSSFNKTMITLDGNSDIGEWASPQSPWVGFYFNLSNCKAGRLLVQGNYVNSVDANVSSWNAYIVNSQLYVCFNETTVGGRTLTNIKNYLASNPLQIVYELATPIEIQLTPHEISLLKDYAYVSTNGTNIALDYHNGELASLADVSQLGETVNELGEFWKSSDSWQILDATQLGTTGATVLYAHGAMRILTINESPTGASEGLVLTLPEGHRPYNTSGGVCLMQDGSNWRTGMVSALKSGKVTSVVFNPNTSTLSYANNMTLYRAEIIYMVDTP